MPDHTLSFEESAEVLLSNHKDFIANTKEDFPEDFPFELILDYLDALLPEESPSAKGLKEYERSKRQAEKADTRWEAQNRKTPCYGGRPPGGYQQPSL